MNRADRKTQINQLFADNTSRDISEEDLRTVSNNDVDSSFSLDDDNDTNISMSDTVRFGNDLNAALNRLRGRYGTVAIGDVQNWSSGTSFPVSGDIAIATSLGSRVIQITLSSGLHNTNYMPNVAIESLGTFNFDNDIATIPFKKVSQSQFQLFLQELGNITQNVTLHINVRAF